MGNDTRLWGSSTRYQRRKESTILVEHVHGGTDGAVYGAWDYLCKNADQNILEKLILDLKKGKWFEKLYGKFGEIHRKSSAGLNQAIAQKYSLHLSRRRYHSMCKIQSATFDTTNQEWQKKSICYGERNISLLDKGISHKIVDVFVKKLNIGDIQSLPNICGVFRTVTALITMVIDLHLKTKVLREKLLWFNGIENHFICEFSDDGAPETKEATMCIGSLSFWNFGSRIRSREFQYLLHAISANEKDEIASLLWQQHADEMTLLEGNILHINNENVTKHGSSGPTMNSLNQPPTAPCLPEYIRQSLPR